MGNPLRPFIDVLLVTALEEEQHVLRKHYFHNVSMDPIEGKEIYLEQINIGHNQVLNVALADLGGMGNVWAMDSSIKLIEGLSPKCAILLGLAGGKRGLVKRGDVVYSTSIGYSSFSKITSVSLKDIVKDKALLSGNEINAGIKSALDDFAKNLKSCDFDINDVLMLTKVKPRQTENINISQKFIDVCSKISKNDAELIELSKTWFRSCKNNFNKEDWAEGYPKQKFFERRQLKSIPGAFASGESIIADDNYQEEIESVINKEDKRSKKQRKVVSFEMEAFGFAKACKLKNVLFGVIKGISDYAGADKSDYPCADVTTDESDLYRLASITSSSAFVWKLINSRSFHEILKEKIHSNWHRTACIWTSPDNHQACSILRINQDHDAKKIFYRDRECTRPEEAPAEIISKQVPRGNIFEDVDAQHYSEWIAESVKDSEAKILLMYPYSTREICIFLEYSQTEDWKNKIEKIRLDATRADTPEDYNKLAKQTKLLGEQGRDIYKHLIDTEKTCIKMITDGCSFPNIAHRISRIVFFNDSDLIEMKSDLLSLLHLSICGICVPTLIVRETKALSYIVDEATFVKKPGVRGKGYITRCLKYAEKSKLLTLMGRCDNLSRTDAPYGKIYQQANDIFNFLSECYESGSLKKHSHYNVFPTIKLIEHYGFSWKDFIPSSLYDADQTSIIENYFNQLRDIECEFIV